MTISTGSIKSMAIAFLLAAILLPIALETIFAVDTANWSTTAQTIWELLPIGGLVAIAFAFFPRGGSE